jgi:hypothetical protein
VFASVRAQRVFCSRTTRSAKVFCFGTEQWNVEQAHNACFGSLCSLRDVTTIKEHMKSNFYLLTWASEGVRISACAAPAEAGRLDKDGRRYYERFIARMRVAWNLAYHSTRRQQDTDRQDRDRSADTSPSFQPNDRASSCEFPPISIRTRCPVSGEGPTASHPLLGSCPMEIIVSRTSKTDVDVRRSLATGCASTPP